MRVKIKLPIKKFAAREGVSYATILRRLHRGEITEPVHKTATGRYFVEIEEEEGHR